MTLKGKYKGMVWIGKYMKMYGLDRVGMRDLEGVNV